MTTGPQSSPRTQSASANSRRAPTVGERQQSASANSRRAPTVGERQQVVRHGAVGARLLVDRPIRLRRQQACHDNLLVDIQPAAALVRHPHDPSLRSVSLGGKVDREAGSVRCLLLGHTLLRATHTRARQRPVRPVRRDTPSNLLAGSWHDGTSPSDPDPRAHFHPCRRVSPRENWCSIHTLDFAEVMPFPTMPLWFVTPQGDEPATTAETP
jgi:hypothetical protein